MSLVVSDWRDLKKVEDELQTGGVTSAAHTRLRDFMRMVRLFTCALSFTPPSPVARVKAVHV